MSRGDGMGKPGGVEHEVFAIERDIGPDEAAVGAGEGKVADGAGVNGAKPGGGSVPACGGGGGGVREGYD
jgi:hypothetical protein